MRRFVSPLILLVVALSGCDATVRPPSSTPLSDQLAVYSIVQAGDSTQYALVTRPRPADEWQTQYVQGASVKIAGQSLSVVPEDTIGDLRQPPLPLPMETNRNYVTDSLPIGAGETVRLRVTREEQTVTGTVEVPGAFQGAVDSMTVHWRPSAGAQEYTLRVRRYKNVGGVAWAYTTTTTDTMATIPDVRRYGEDFQQGPHDIIITAVDSNYVSYKDEEARRSGIEGGFGIFGAVTRIAGTVTLPATDQTKQGTVGGLSSE